MWGKSKIIALLTQIATDVHAIRIALTVTGDVKTLKVTVDQPTKK